MEYLRERGCSWEDCAEILFISRSTLWRRLREIGYMPTFSEITNGDLDAVVSRIQHDSPNNGAIMVWGEIRSYGICVPRQRVRESLLRVNATNVQSRAMTTVVRRTYNVPSSNALWHIDGLHCLIRWRIVIHGGIDGHSRLIVYLGASDNNKSSTVLDLFLKATEQYSWPSRVRADYGGENIEVARHMINATWRDLVCITNGLRGCGETYFDVCAICITRCFMKWKCATYCALKMKLNSFAFTMYTFLALTFN